MSRNETYSGYTSITLSGRVIEGEKLPKDWVWHFYEVQDDGQWAKLTYRFEAKLNPDASFHQASQALKNLRSSGKSFDRDILNYLERMVLQQKRFSMDSLFEVKKPRQV